jgi:hypothetical protein
MTTKPPPAIRAPHWPYRAVEEQRKACFREWLKDAKDG